MGRRLEAPKQAAAATIAALRPNGATPAPRLTVSPPEHGGKAPAPRALTRLNIEELLRHEWPAREPICGEWLVTRSLSMIYGARGIGKSWLTLSIAYGIAAGSAACGWSVPSPRRVVLLDGEMPGVVLAERLERIAKAHDAVADPGNLVIVARDAQEDGRMFDLAAPAGRELADDAIGDAEVVIVDNLSALSSARENEGDDWAAVGEWALRHRSHGRAVVLIHHAGKGGGQRGTSRKEDLLDIVFALRRCDDADPSEGARFDLHVEKARHLVGPALDPVRLSLAIDGQGAARWSREAAADAMIERARDLAADGYTKTQAAEELGINRWVLDRMLEKAGPSGAQIAFAEGRGGSRRRTRS